MVTSIEQRSIGELFGELTHDVNLLIRQEIALARVELEEKASQFRRDAAAVATGVFVMYLGALGLAAGLILVLDQVAGLATWLAALLVGVAFAGIGYVMLRRSLESMQHIDPTPRRTVETLKDNVQWAKEQS